MLKLKEMNQVLSDRITVSFAVLLGCWWCNTQRRPCLIFLPSYFYANLCATAWHKEKRAHW